MWYRSMVLACACCAAGCAPASPSFLPASSAASDVPKAPALDDVVARLHAALAAKNPGYEREHVAFDPPEGVPTAAEFQSAGLRDLSPLTGLPLTWLALRGNPVEDLSPLAGMPLNELYLEETAVSDLTPLRGLPLRKLGLNHAPVTDLSPLQGLPLVQLNLLGTLVTDLSPLEGLPLEQLWLNETKVTDLRPLANRPLVSLTLHATLVNDVAVVRRLPTLQRLHIGETQVTDLRPLAGLRLTRLIVTPRRIQHGWDVVRQMDTLTELDVDLREPHPWRPEEFWRRFDAGELR